MCTPSHERGEPLAFYVVAEMAGSLELIELHRRVQVALSQAGADFQSVPRSRLHVTLIYAEPDASPVSRVRGFLRRVDLAPADAFDRLLRESEPPPGFEIEALSLAMMGAALVLRVSAAPALVTFQRQLAESARGLGLSLSPYSDPGAYRPHVSLAYDVRLPEGTDPPRVEFPPFLIPITRFRGMRDDWEPVAEIMPSFGPWVGLSQIAERRRLHRVVVRAATIRGGPGSGHHGHKGRPGKRGGSLPRGAGAATPSGLPMVGPALGAARINGQASAFQWTPDGRISGRVVIESTRPLTSADFGPDRVRDFVRAHVADLKIGLMGPADVAEIALEGIESGDDWIIANAEIMPTVEAKARAKSGALGAPAN